MFVLYPTVQTGCLPGDTAGFPVTISQPGSDVLTGNLSIVPTGSLDALELSGSGVAFDLHGFTITGSARSGTGISIRFAGDVALKRFKADFPNTRRVRL